MFVKRLTGAFRCPTMALMPKRLSNDEPTVSIGVRLPLSVATQLSLRADAEGVPVSVVARQAMVRGLDVVSPGAGPKVSTEVILPKVVEPGPWREGVLESRGGKTDVRPAVRVPTEDGAKLVDQGTGEVVAVEKGRPARAKVQHHDDAVVGGGALVKCRRCTLVKTAARPEVCDG